MSRGLLIAGDWLLPISSSPLKNGWVAVQDDSIVGIGTLQDITKEFRAFELMRFENAIVMPALINAHTHLENSLFKGKLSGLAFEDWLPQMAQLVRNQTPQEALEAARLGVRQSLACGVTTIADCSRHWQSLQAIAEVGLRGIIFKELICLRDVEAEAMLFELQDWIWSAQERCSPLVRLGISPHAPYTVSPKAFKLALQFAESENLLVCTHAAESKAECDLLFDRTGAFASLLEDLDVAQLGLTPIAYLNALGVLGERTLLVHCVQVNAEDIATMAQRHVRVAHCPRSNRNLGVGDAPVPKMLEAGVTAVLGTDGLGSSDSLSPLDEAAFAFQVHPALGAERLVRMVTSEAAKALGLQHEVGTVEVGKKADLTVVELGAETLEAKPDPYLALLTAPSRTVRLTMVNGQILFSMTNDQ